MPDDTSLDDFFDADGDESDPADEGEDGAEREAAAEERTDRESGSDAKRSETVDDVDPATPTATWSPEGAPCGVCGDVVQRRWREGESLVCSACKAW